eukprot:34083_1
MSTTDALEYTYGTVSPTLFHAVLFIGFSAFLFDAILLIYWLVSEKQSICPNWRVLAVIILSAFSSLIAIIFSLDPDKYQTMSSSLNSLCHAQAISMEIIYIFQSIILLLLVQFYDFGFIKNICSFNKINKHHVGSQSIGSSEELVQIPNNDCNKIKVLSLLFTSVICFSACIITVFGYGYSIHPISDVTNNEIQWYACYCQNPYACYLLWGLPHALLEMYFITTSIMTYTKVVENANIDQAQIIVYIVIRFLIIMCLLPIAMANINNQEMADYYAGYMSFTLIFISMLSIFTMVIPKLYTRKHALPPLPARKYGFHDVNELTSPDSYQDENNKELQITINENKKTAPLKGAKKHKNTLDSLLTGYSTTDVNRLSPRDAIKATSITSDVHPLRTSTLLSLTRVSLPDSRFANLSISERKAEESITNDPSLKSNTNSSKSKTKSSSNESFKHSHGSNTGDAVGDIEIQALKTVKEINDDISVNIDE